MNELPGKTRDGRQRQRKAANYHNIPAMKRRGATVCEAAGCKTRLNSYNKSRYCNVHAVRIFSANVKAANVGGLDE